MVWGLFGFGGFFVIIATIMAMEYGYLSGMGGLLVKARKE